MFEVGEGQSWVTRSVFVICLSIYGIFSGASKGQLNEEERKFSQVGESHCVSQAPGIGTLSQRLCSRTQGELVIH
jgi:hypothetical protein